RSVLGILKIHEFLFLLFEPAGSVVLYDMF
ncbi:MAG: hypothetical protein ACI8RD_012152, partial [Bacillariaceae sp.]